RTQGRIQRAAAGERRQRKRLSQLPWEQQMKTFKTAVLALALGASTLLSVPALAQAAADLADAEVRKVDKENRKITLKHGEIKSLDMPPMTMVFGVSDPAMLEKVKAG